MRKKKRFFLHTSVVPSSPRWHRQEMGMTASCPGRLWRQAASYGVAAEQCSCAFTGFFVMRDLQLPQRRFICDLVLPSQMAISRLTRPLRSCRTASGKIKVTPPSAGTSSGLYLTAYLLRVLLNGDLTPSCFVLSHDLLCGKIISQRQSRILFHFFSWKPAFIRFPSLSFSLEVAWAALENTCFS